MTIVLYQVIAVGTEHYCLTKVWGKTMHVACMAGVGLTVALAIIASIGYHRLSWTSLASVGYHWLLCVN